MHIFFGEMLAEWHERSLEHIAFLDFFFLFATPVLMMYILVPFLPCILGLFCPSTRSLLPSFWLLSLSLSSSLFSAFRFFPEKKNAQKSVPIFFKLCVSQYVLTFENLIPVLSASALSTASCVCVCVCVCVWQKLIIIYRFRRQLLLAFSTFFLFFLFFPFFPLLILIAAALSASLFMLPTKWLKIK